MLLASGSWDNTVQLWDVQTHTNIATLHEGRRRIVTSVSFSPDGTLLASGSTDDTVQLWDVQTHTNIATLGGHTRNITSVSFSPDGTILASGSDDGTVKLWNISEWTNTLEIISGDSQEGITDTALASPLVVEVRDRGNNPLPDVQVTFTVTRGEGLLSGESTAVEVTTDANGRAAQTLILGLKPGRNYVKVSIGSKSVTFEAEGVSPYQLVKISGDEQRGVSGIALANPLVVEVRDRGNNPLPDVQVTFTVTEGDGLLSGASTAVEVTTNTNGKVSQTFTLGYTITNIIEVSIGYERVEFYSAAASLSNIDTLEGHRGTVTSVSFAPNGTLLASGSEDNTVKLWAVKNHTHIATLEGHQGFVHSVSFSPDGTLLASGSEDDTVKLWDVPLFVNCATLEGHQGFVHSVSFSPDGTLLAAGSTDTTVKLWDAKTHTNIATLEGHQGLSIPCRFHPTGRCWLPEYRYYREAVGCQNPHKYRHP